MHVSAHIGHAKPQNVSSYHHTMDPIIIEKTLKGDSLSTLPIGKRQGWEQVALKLRSPIWVSDILCFEEHAVTIIILTETH